jgi:tRNA(fMet)-specific endonuclease VapC
MIALDTDIATLLFLGDQDVLHKLQVFPRKEIGLPIIVIEEIIRGRLDQIRKHQARRDARKLTDSYRNLFLSSMFVGGFQVYHYDESTERVVEAWRAAKIRVGTQDMRIAAICIESKATLITRNTSDFSQLTGLSVITWN